MKLTEPQLNTLAAEIISAIPKNLTASWHEPVVRVLKKWLIVGNGVARADLRKQHV